MTLDSGVSEGLKVSVGYALGEGQRRDRAIKAKVEALERHVPEGGREVLARLAGVAGEKLSQAGFGGVGSEVQNRAAVALERARVDRLTQAVAGWGNRNPSWLEATINAIDPPDILINVTQPKAGEPRVIRVRRSMGLKPGDTAYVVEHEAKQFPQPDSGHIIIAGRKVELDQIRTALRGEGKLKPMWGDRGAVVPITYAEMDPAVPKGQREVVALVRLSQSQIRSLEAVLGARPLPRQPAEQAGSVVPVQQERAFDAAEIKYGAYGLWSPDHIREDDYGNTGVVDKSGRVMGFRVFSIDGSGNALKGSNIPEADRPRKIQEKVQLIKGSLAYSSSLDGRQALENVQQAALAQTENPAYAGVVVVDVLTDEVVVNRRGDHSVVKWRGQEYNHRRGEAWGANRGDPSCFQSVDRPQNMAYVMKAIDAGGVNALAGQTAYLEDAQGANTIIAAVGSASGPAQETRFKRSNETEWLLILSDGARGSGMMLDANTPYSREVNRIMSEVKAGRLNEGAAAMVIANNAARVWGERDDISVQIVKIPPVGT